MGAAARESKGAKPGTPPFGSREEKGGGNVLRTLKDGDSRQAHMAGRGLPRLFLCGAAKREREERVHCTAQSQTEIRQGYSKGEAAGQLPQSCGGQSFLDRGNHVTQR